MKLCLVAFIKKIVSSYSVTVIKVINCGSKEKFGENLFLISIHLSYFDLLPIGLGARVRDNS